MFILKMSTTYTSQKRPKNFIANLVGNSRFQRIIVAYRCRVLYHQLYLILYKSFKMKTLLLYYTLYIYFTCSPRSRSQLSLLEGCFRMAVVDEWRQQSRLQKKLRKPCHYPKTKKFFDWGRKFDVADALAKGNKDAMKLF